MASLGPQASPDYMGIKESLEVQDGFTFLNYQVRNKAFLTCFSSAGTVGLNRGSQPSTDHGQ